MGELQARSCKMGGTGCSTSMGLAVVGSAIPNWPAPMDYTRT